MKITTRTLSCALLALLLFFTLAAASARAENIKIIRDEYGVPHIYATTDEALFYGQGYVMAEDRLFQLEMCRQAASGKLASLYGDKYTDYDRLQRRDIFTDTDIQKLYLTLPEAQKKLYNAFALGINQYIKEARELPAQKLSREFHTLNITPAEWKGEDVIRVYLNSFWNFFDCSQELKNAAFYRYAMDKFGQVDGKNLFDDVIWMDDPGAPSTLPHWTPPGKKTTLRAPAPSPSIGAVAAQCAREHENYRHTMQSMGVPFAAGSYAVLVSGKKSATGNAMLLGGPQVTLGMPSYLYETGLHGKDTDCVGCAYIGIPGMLVGQNKDLCWTITIGKDNQVDYFAEKVNPKNDKQYWYKGKWVDMEKESHFIKIKDKKDVIYDIYRTVHGPVISWDNKDPLNPVAYSRSISYSKDQLENWNSAYHVVKARNADEFFNATRSAGYSINWLCADRKGDISYMHSGRYPLRAPEADPRLPADGTGPMDWKGFRDPSELPQGKNPPEGYLVNWNSKPAPGWDNGERSFLWGVQNRASLFLSYLSSQEHREISFQDMKEMDRIASTTNIYAPEIKPLLLAALSTNEELKEPYKALRDWNDRYEDRDGDGLYDSPGALVFDAWWDIFVKDLLSPDLGEYYTLAVNNQGAPLVLRVLKKDGLKHDFLNGRDTSTIMAASMKKAVAQIGEKYGKDPSKWYKKVTPERFEPQVLPRLNLATSTAPEITVPHENRGSIVQIVEASKLWIKGVNVAPPGISGFVSKEGKASPHLKDQLNLYLDRKYKDMLFYPEDVQHHVESTKLIEYRQ